jgi:hypothetical protein
MRITTSDSVKNRTVSIEITGQVLRCRCGDPNAHKGNPCPKGEIEMQGRRGLISAYYRNPLKRLYVKLLLSTTNLKRRLHKR